MAKTVVDIWDAGVSQHLSQFTARAASLLPKLAEDCHNKTRDYYHFPTVKGIDENSFYRKYVIEAFFDTSALTLMHHRHWLCSRLDAEYNETWSLKILVEDDDDDAVDESTATYRELRGAVAIVQWFVDNGFEPDPDSAMSLESPLRYCSRMITMFKTWRFHPVYVDSPREDQLKWWIEHSILDVDQVYGRIIFSRGPKNDTVVSEREGDNGRNRVVVALGLDQDTDIYEDATLVRVARLLTADEARALCFYYDV